MADEKKAAATSATSQRSRRADSRDRLAAACLVAGTAVPAAMAAVPVVAGIWVFCGRWTDGYRRCVKVSRKPLALHKRVIRRTAEGLDAEDRATLDDLLDKI